MSILVLQIPPRARGGGAAAADAGGDIAYVLSPDGLNVAAQGRAPLAGLPKADTVVAVLADCDVAWHRLTLPKAPASRLRAALVGLMEEALLDEPEATHLALAPGASAGVPTWVAAVDKPWLMSQLAFFERAGHNIDRVVPSSWPDEAASGHFCEDETHPEAGAESIDLVWSDANGVACVGLQGTLARALVPIASAEASAAIRWTATPAVAAPAERWLGAPVLVQTREQRLLQATRSLWNLRQFDLASRHKGARALRDALVRFMSPGWRPVRWAVIGLVAINLIGMNLWAWHLNRMVKQRQADMAQLVQTTYPQVKVVIDAPLQMQREADALRAAAGKPGDGDLEPLLQAAASAWPPGRPPVEMLRFEPGKLTLGAAGWSPDQVNQFRNQLQPAGWQIDFNNNTELVISRNNNPNRPGVRS
jgi:general secretion pathway protein L